MRKNGRNKFWFVIRFKKLKISRLHILYNRHIHKKWAYYFFVDMPIIDMTYREVNKILPNNIHNVKSHVIFDIPFDYRYKYPIGY